MELSKHGFDQPSRQAPAAILFILIRWVWRLAKQFWPIVLILMIRPGEETGSRLIWIAAGLSGVSLPLSIIAYFRLYFYIRNDELVVEKGIFKRVRVSVPIGRIQTIDFEQDLLHRMLGAVRIKVDTAGSSKDEISLAALSQEKAEALRDYLLQEKERVGPLEEEVNSEGETNTQAVNKSLLLERTPMELVTLGLSQNHLQTAALILAFSGGLFSQFDQLLDINIEELVSNITGDQISTFWGYILFGLPFFILLAVLISMVRMAVQNYGLKLWSTSRGLKLEAGFLNRREQSASNRRIQLIRWSTQPLKQLFGWLTLRLYQASSVQVSRKKSITIAGCREEELEQVIATQIPAGDRQEMSRHGIDPRIIFRRWRFWGPIPALVVMLGSWGFVEQWVGLGLLWLPVAWLLCRRYQRRWVVAYNPEVVHLHHEIIGSSDTLAYWHKVQAVSLSQGIYQRRKQLADVHLYTAAGQMKIPYLPLSQAQALRDYALYKIESDEREWM